MALSSRLIKHYLEIKTYSRIPQEFKDGSVQFSKCSMYSENISISSKGNIQPCLHGWNYDLKEINTVVNEVKIDLLQFRNY